MRKLSRAEHLFEAIARIKNGAERFLTNLFVTPSRVQSWMEQTDLWYVETDRGMLLIRPHPSCLRVYHAVAQVSELSRLLDCVTLYESGLVIAADLVGYRNEIEETASVYKRHQFREYTSLIRMARVEGSASQHAERRPIDFAGANDVSSIGAFLNRVLDPVRDQAPSAFELEAAVSSESILIDKIGEEIRALLFFERLGLTSILRYWYVDPASLNRGIGGALMREYLQLSRSMKRILLWVVADNVCAIEKYAHYGFRPDGLADRIMLLDRRN